MRTSIGSVIVMPTPTAGPLMAAITGFFDSKMRSVTRPPPSRCLSMVSGFEPLVWSKVPLPPERSAPAQKARPAPVTMIDPHGVVGVGAIEGVDHLVHHRGR